MRKPSSWNQFMKTKKARATFQGRHQGVKYSPAMGSVSVLWKQLTREQQEAFKQPVQATTDGNIEGGQDEPNANEFGEDDNEMDDKVVGSGNQVGTRRPISLKVAATEVENFMDDWDAKAMHIATTFSCELVVFAVSKFLGRHSFQFIRSTPGATDFVQGAERVDGPRSYAARMQSYLTGYQVSDIAAAIAQINNNGKQNGQSGESGGKDQKGAFSPDRPVSAVLRMSELIKKTDGVITQWPWTKTDYNLAQLKYRLVLDPAAKIDVNWLKRPSQGLGPKRSAALHLALDKQLIDIVFDPSIPDKVFPESYDTPGPSPSPSASPQPTSPAPFQEINSVHIRYRGGLK
ncbi:hypothetical protein PtA15_3A739 [Puccinia triticina]|uniref:HMG box domain-containing protein n=1 Tax=Puccinia triticina TaxID=208348 RepID=A0ABY7CDT9_9BASI|nr:uncharacterized protein PtA15_3A739 [Puccinia triticina]WAQ83369.1 hypothetical protein PtA15_3A739 [Puccinia triticina]